jgi:hypothetical protein
MIEQYLLGMRNNEAMQARVKQLREGASIAYAVEFEKPQSVVTASTSP